MPRADAPRKDESLRSLYFALRRSPDRRLALEEFLVACGAKKPLKLSVDREPQTYVCREDELKGELVITRSGSGYCLISVKQKSLNCPSVVRRMV